ncbi:hypothetical protein B0H14DRAFT_3510113 [Mycena olivaceomarginata]|nr:hypothetical protein B0H14DRAFT_3510113 [Mycena olivaceomarginata]
MAAVQLRSLFALFAKPCQPLASPTGTFSALREIQFIVHGSPFVLRASARAARERFELLLLAILPPRATSTRQVVCIDGEDPDEVWC